MSLKCKLSKENCSKFQKEYSVTCKLVIADMNDFKNYYFVDVPLTKGAAAVGRALSVELLLYTVEYLRCLTLQSLDCCLMLRMSCVWTRSALDHNCLCTSQNRQEMIHL